MNRVLIACLVVGSIVVQSCARTIVKDGETSLDEFTVSCPRDKVFDETLLIAQRRNLEVKVLEKSSGFIRFERTPFGTQDLDAYVTFPLVSSRDGQPVSTYDQWVRDYGERAFGTVNLNVLLTQVPPNSTRVSIRGNWVVTVTREGDTIPATVNSTGTFEKEIRQDLVAGTCGPAPTTSKREKLEQLKSLKDRGLISGPEYEQKRRTIEAAEG